MRREFKMSIEDLREEIDILERAIKEDYDPVDIESFRHELAIARRELALKERSRELNRRLDEGEL